MAAAPQAPPYGPKATRLTTPLPWTQPALRGDHDGVARRTGEARWRRVGCVRHDEVIEGKATRDSHGKGTRLAHLLVATSGKLPRDLVRGRGTVAVDRARTILVAKKLAYHRSIGHRALREGRGGDDAGVRLDRDVALGAS